MLRSAFKEGPLITKTQTTVGLSMVYISYAGFFLILCMIAFMYIDGVYSVTTEMYDQYNNSVEANKQFKPPAIRFVGTGD